MNNLKGIMIFYGICGLTYLGAETVYYVKRNKRMKKAKEIFDLKEAVKKARSNNNVIEVEYSVV